MRATRIRDLVGYAVLVGVISWLVTKSAYASFPAMQWFVPLSLPLLAVVEGVLAFQFRRRIHRAPRPTRATRSGSRLDPPDGNARPFDPLMAPRAVALAKASSIVGSVMTGAWCGLLAYVIPRRDTLLAAHEDTFVAAIGAAGAVVLVAAALWLEYACRTPDQPDDESTAERGLDRPADPRR